MTQYATMTTAVSVLDTLDHGTLGVIPWSCPVPYFGDLGAASVATVGINPSNREFTCDAGVELAGDVQRLPTLRSLGLSAWADADASHVREIVESCTHYFRSNPYDRWFRVLEQILIPSGASFYGKSPSACHVDLVPYATTAKWGTLRPIDQSDLLDASAETFAAMLRHSRVEVLVLNGRSVVRQFEMVTDAQLHVAPMPRWSLPRASGAHVQGFAYSGTIDALGGMPLGRSVKIVGYNHNLQSSFGVTSQVTGSIGAWLRHRLR